MRIPPDFQTDGRYRIVGALLDRIERDYPKDIALVAVYGSYVTGKTHPKSDIDFYFVPKTARGYEMSRQFIIGDIGYDFWPFPFERMEQAIEQKSPRAGLIHQARAVFYGSEADQIRYRQLADRAARIERPEARIPEGYYEELKSAYNKLLHACAIRDHDLAQHASDIIREATREILPDTRFPPFIGTFAEIEAACRAHEEQLLAILGAQGVAITIYGTIDAFIQKEAE